MQRVHFFRNIHVLIQNIYLVRGLSSLLTPNKMYHLILNGVLSQIKHPLIFSRYKLPIHSLSDVWFEESIYSI